MNGFALNRGQVGTGFRHRLAAAIRTAGPSENGALTIFALILFVLMTMMGGLAVDLMKYEQTRTALQNTLDRSTLAAASLTQGLDPETVVRDYFDAAGMSGSLTNVVVTEGINFRNVQADASADTRPSFLHMLGITELDAPGTATAEQRIGNVEIVLVLDVSGSMGGDKLANLKTAATEFIDTLLGDDTEDRFSVAIVPYNAQVNLGATLRSKYNAVHLNNRTDLNCLELPSSVYNTAGVSRTLALPMVAYADVVSSTDTSNNSYVDETSTSSSKGATMDTNDLHCKTTAANVVRLPSNNVATLKSQINALVAGGNTSITLGMKWGLSLIEPGARDMFDSLIDQGAIAESFRGRPYDWTDDEAMKVIVVMTDGEHVAHDKVNDAYKTGTAPIWRSTGDGNYSMYYAAHSGSSDYWVPHKGSWYSAPWNSGSGVTQLDWREVWQRQRLTWVAYQLYGRGQVGSTNRSTAYSNAMTQFRSQYESVSTMNANLQKSCTLAKDNGVIVYGIAFEAETNGQTQISKCASSAAHYFDAEGLEIQSAFRTIASNISQLRLTQ